MSLFRPRKVGASDRPLSAEEERRFYEVEPWELACGEGVRRVPAPDIAAEVESWMADYDGLAEFDRQLFECQRMLEEER